MSWAAVKGSTPQAVRDALALRDTGGREAAPESDINGAELPGGWYLVTSNRDRLNLTGDEVLTRLSTIGEVIACVVEEHVMISSAAGWRSGKQVWSVAHDSQRGIEHLDAKGDLPPKFASIHDELRSQQEAAGGKKAGVDHIFDVPVVLVHELIGWRHDEDIPGLEGDVYEVLATASDAKSEKTEGKSPWKKLFGG